MCRRDEVPMKHGSLIGLWVVRMGSGTTGSTLLGRVRDELYLLAFTSALLADRCMQGLGADGGPFYVCRANVDALVFDARQSGACGFIVDYDVARSSFRDAYPLPVQPPLADAPT